MGRKEIYVREHWERARFRRLTEAEKGAELAAEEAVSDQVKQGRVYFLQEEDAGPVKVGFSVDLDSRLVTLRGGNWRPLNLVGTIEAEPSIERLCHRALAAHRIRNEWFERDAALELLKQLSRNPDARGYLCGLIFAPRAGAVTHAA